MLTINNHSFDARVSNLLGVFEKLGLKLDIRSFEKRLRIQKIVYMLQLHPEFKPYLNYHYNLFIYGPYSPELAFVYYHMPENIAPAEIKVSSRAIEYGKEISRWDNSLLEEIASTLIEAIKINKGRIEDEELVKLVHELKPYHKRDKIDEILKMLRGLKEKYGLDF